MCSATLHNVDVKKLAVSTCRLASTPGPTELVGPGSRPLILHGWSLGNAIAQKHHYDNAHKQLTVCWRSQELLLSTTSSCQHLFQMLGSLHGDGTDSARYARQPRLEPCLRECVGSVWLPCPRPLIGVYPASIPTIQNFQAT